MTRSLLQAAVEAMGFAIRLSPLPVEGCCSYPLLLPHRGRRLRDRDHDRPRGLDHLVGTHRPMDHHRRRRLLFLVRPVN